ncbi:MAG: amidohydrolase, partial [Deltaproteobacteria bacterium]
MNRLSAILHSFLPSLLLLVTACGSSPAPQPEAPMSSDAVVYVNARLLTLDDRDRAATALRVEGGHITHVLDADDEALSGQRVDLEGATIVPGLVDAHLHLRSLGRARRSVDLLGAQSADEVIARIREAAANTPPGQWIRGRGWDQNDWAETVFPTHEALSAAVPDHPVWLVRVDGHAVWVNARAMELAALDAMEAGAPSPEGGEIVRDAEGAPTGIFIDNAMDLLGGALPEDSAEEIRGDLERAMRLCAQAGVTGVHDMGVGLETLTELRALEAEGRMPVRVTVYLAGGAPGVDALLESPPDNEGLLRVVGVKYFSDGALGSRGAALFEDYADRPGHRGLLVLSTEELTTRARHAHAAGYQLAIHAIGDQGIASALDAIAAAVGDETSHRHRIEHVQVIRAEDVPRLASLGVVASMQPKHATSDMPWA